MSETLHRPTVYEMPPIDPLEARAAYDRAVGDVYEPTKHVSSIADESPRLTPARLEALQNFTTASMYTPEQAHTEALKDYRKVNRADYSAHIYDMAQNEANGDLDSGRYYRNALLRENIQTTIEEKFESAPKAVKELGRLALEKTTDLASDILETSLTKIDRKVRNIQFNRAMKKQMAGYQKEAIKENKKFDRNTRREDRKDQIEAFISPKVEKVRKLGAFALNIKDTGLSILSAEKAQAIKERKVKETRENFLNALGQYNLQEQLVSVQELLDDEKFQPKSFISTHDEIGFISDIFTTEEKPGKFSAVFYEDTTDGKLLPQLLDYDQGTETWKRRDELLPEGYKKWSKSDREIYAHASEKLVESNEANIVSVDHLDSLIKKITPKVVASPVYEGKNPDKSIIHRAKSEMIREKREALIKAKQLAKQRDARNRAAQAMKKVASAGQPTKKSNRGRRKVA